MVCNGYPQVCENRTSLPMASGTAGRENNSSVGSTGMRSTSISSDNAFQKAAFRFASSGKLYMGKLAVSSVISGSRIYARLRRLVRKGHPVYGRRQHAFGGGRSFNLHMQDEGSGTSAFA